MFKQSRAGGYLPRPGQSISAVLFMVTYAVGVHLFYQFNSNSSIDTQSQLPQNASVSQLIAVQPRRELRNPTIEIKSNPNGGDDRYTTPRECTMSSCFDMARCGPEFKFYMYDSNVTEKDSNWPGPVWGNQFINGLKASKYYTTNPEEACVFLVLPVCTNCIWTYYGKYGKPEFWKEQLAHWGEHGNNHIFIIIMDNDDPEPIGNAILAKTNWHSALLRQDFDISYPLLAVWEHGGRFVPIEQRRYLMVAKLTRYQRRGSVRNFTRLLDNGKDIVVRIVCREDIDRVCQQDADLYNNSPTMEALLPISKFGLVPRGYGRHSYRFLETISVGVIPVVLCDDFLFPFHELIDWTKCAIQVPEKHLLDIPDLLRTFTIDQIRERAATCFRLWGQYFESVTQQSEVMWQILRRRIYKYAADPDLWTAQ